MSVCLLQPVVVTPFGWTTSQTAAQFVISVEVYAMPIWPVYPKPGIMRFLQAERKRE